MKGSLNFKQETSKIYNVLTMTNEALVHKLLVMLQANNINDTPTNSNYTYKFMCIFYS